MGDSKLPDMAGVDPTLINEIQGLEVFEIAGSIKWFDVSKGYWRVHGGSIKGYGSPIGCDCDQNCIN